MASITIGPSASSGYPLASDNVFGPPSTADVTYTYGFTGPTGELSGSSSDEEYFYYSYATGLTYFYINWSAEIAPPTTTIMYFDLKNVYGYGGINFYYGQIFGSAYQIRTDGITYVANTPFLISEYHGHGSSGPLFTEGLRTFDEAYPATVLALADTITNLSSTGAVLTGYAGADTILGGAGNDTLDGGTGRDSLTGGLGDDTYYVDYGDRIVELAGEGFDTVFTASTFVAPAGASIERVVATGSGAVAITGNGSAMDLVGNSGINTLDDGGGASTLSGGANVDVYWVRNAATVVTELAGEGYDTVKTDLAAYTLTDNVEVLIHVGAGAFSGIGNGLSNVLTGGGGADTLSGAGGTDVLTGGGGSDLFVFGGTGLGADRVTDFVQGSDHIGLGAAGFGLATLADVVLVVGDALATVGQATLRYYANGALSFDANGGSGAGSVLFATLDGHPSLAISDFVLV